MKKNKTEELYANRHPIVKRNVSPIVQSPSVHSRLPKIIPTPQTPSNTLFMTRPLIQIDAAQALLDIGAQMLLLSL